MKDLTYIDEIFQKGLENYKVSSNLKWSDLKNKLPKIKKFSFLKALFISTVIGIVAIFINISSNNKSAKILSAFHKNIQITSVKQFKPKIIDQTSKTPVNQNIKTSIKKPKTSKDTAIIEITTFEIDTVEQ